MAPKNRLYSLPREVLAIIYSFDPTYRERFSRRVLLNTAFTLENRLFTNCIHTYYSQRRFYEMIAGKRRNLQGRLMSVLNHLDLNHIYIDWFDYYESKFSMPYWHEIEIIKNWKTPTLPFQKVVLNYRSTIGPPTLYFAIWNKCPLHLVDFVNAYVKRRYIKLSSQSFRQRMIYGIFVSNVRCRLIKDPYVDNGFNFEGLSQIEKISSKKRKYRKCRKAFLSNISHYYDLTLFQEDDGSIVANLNLQEYMFNDVLFFQQTPNRERDGMMLNDFLHDMTQVRLSICGR